MQTFVKGVGSGVEQLLAGTGRGREAAVLSLSLGKDLVVRPSYAGKKAFFGSHLPIMFCILLQPQGLQDDHAEHGPKSGSQSNNNLLSAAKKKALNTLAALLHT